MPDQAKSSQASPTEKNRVVRQGFGCLDAVGQRVPGRDDLFPDEISPDLAMSYLLAIHNLLAK
ncbi:MAG: hypothetical protein N838_06100 [Thiohalocapsa sp. PB-PSB1]|nr:MAG: hypothetical protein N838_06100 [Thiohalocapsa sp. PB-PSB1]